MQRLTPVLVGSALVLAALLVGCTTTSSSPPRGSASRTEAPTSAPAERSAACTPTAPNGSTPPGEAPSATFYGNGEMWTALWKDGTIVFEPGGAGEIRPDGSLAMKFPFWRGERARGKLTVEGRRLDRPGATMTAEVPDGYGDTGFQPTGLVFPEPGCWEVTARCGDASLTFVTRVVVRK